MAQWLNTDEYPFRAHYFSINGHKLHYIDEGQGEILLFVHGTPSWSFDFRNVIKTLSRKYRCIAIDHIGFGLSDKPKHYDYSTQNHSRTLEAFILQKDLKDITLIVHDFGGPTGFDTAIKQSLRISRIVTLNTWLWSSKHDPGYIRFSKILRSPLLPFLYLQLNFSPRFLLPASFGDHKLPSKLKSQYTKPFGSSSERQGPLAFAKSLLNDQDWFESLWQQKEILSDKPILFIWGMKDKFITPKYLEKFTAAFSNARVIKLEHAGHFPQEEEPEVVSKAIENFMLNNIL